MKCQQPHPGFELSSASSIPNVIIDTLFLYVCVCVCVCKLTQKDVCVCVYIYIYIYIYIWVSLFCPNNITLQFFILIIITFTPYRFVHIPRCSISNKWIRYYPQYSTIIYWLSTTVFLLDWLDFFNVELKTIKTITSVIKNKVDNKTTSALHRENLNT